MANQPIQAFGGKGLLAKAPDALRTDTLVFLSCRHAVNLDTGAVPRDAGSLPPAVRQMYASARYIDPMEWPMTVQTWWIYEAFRRILEPLGAGLEHLVRTNTYFRNLGTFPAMERARAAVLPVNPPPSTVLTVPYGHFPARVEVAIEGLAALPSGGPREVVRAQLGSGAHYVWANSVREKIWVAGQTPAHPISGEYPRLVEELGLEGRHLATGNRHIDRREGPVSAQAWLTYWRVGTILESAGVGLNDVVQEKIYLRSEEHIPAVERVRRRLFVPAEQAPPAVYLLVVDKGVDDKCLIEVDVIASRGRRELYPGSTDGLERLGAGACASDPFLYLSGWVARDLVSNEVVRSANQLSRFRSVLRDGGSPTEVQGAWIYEKLAAFLQECGSSLGDLVKVDIYVTELADLRALDAVHQAVFGEVLPAISVVPMKGVDHDSEVRLKVSGVAFRPRR